MIPELEDLKRWLGPQRRHPKQRNQIFESDCELVDLPGGVLAVNVDTISEEIAAGLYRDPYTLGWVATMATLSDLAAVGATPIGVAMSCQWGDVSAAYKNAVMTGVAGALERAGTYLLGGDTSSSSVTTLTGVGLGLCKDAPRQRKPLRAGDVLAMTGPVGIGPALSFARLRADKEAEDLERHYRPIARLDRAAVPGAACSIDTSDGLFSALHVLAELNGVGIELAWREDWLALPAMEYGRAKDIPLTAFAAGEHGDYELLLGLTPDATGTDPLLEIGRAVEEPGLRLRLPRGDLLTVDFNEWRSTFASQGGATGRGLAAFFSRLRDGGFP